MKIIERNVQQIGQTLLISLPKEWTRLLKVHKGSKLKIMISEQGNLSIAPDFITEENKLEVTLPFDQYFKGRFFRAYFGGNEKITFLIKQKITDAERKEFYAFLKRFMNVQVIEETTAKIVIKCFKIEELTIEECLKRMYFLLMTMFEEIKEGNHNLKKKETRETMIRFYYMLILQIRRYLSEGKFIEGKQITLIRAMDYRMVAEKIHQTGEILEDIEDKKILGKIKECYTHAFNYYLSNDFEKSAQLLVEIKEVEKKVDVKEKKVLRYAKEICMLTR